MSSQMSQNTTREMLINGAVLKMRTRENQPERIKPQENAIIQNFGSRRAEAKTLQPECSRMGCPRHLGSRSGNRSPRPGRCQNPGPSGRTQPPSDQGSPYAKEVFTSALAHLAMDQSLSRHANCDDHATAESFWAPLKTACCNNTLPATRAEARSMIFDDSETFSNPVRRHSALGFLSPLAFENQFNNNSYHLSDLFGSLAGSQCHVASASCRCSESIYLAEMVSLFPVRVFGSTSIATQSGFANPFHLSRRVKKLTGLPPRELRRIDWEADMNGCLDDKKAR